MRSPLRKHPSCARVALAVGVAAALAAPAAAQQTTPRPLGGRDWSFGPVYEQWSLDEGAAIIRGDPTARQVKSVSQLSLPLIATYSLGANWLLDGYVAYASGTVKLRDGTEHDLSGPTDVKLRASTRLFGENILATFGVNLPTGKVELDADEALALRTLASSAFRLQTPGLGTGVSGTTGLVLTRQIAGWAWGFGASYELRGEYSPLEATGRGLSPELDPGSAIRLSVGADGLLGQSAMSFSLGTTFYTKDRLDAGADPVEIQLGPAVTAELELRFAAPAFTTLTAYAFDRYRSSYKSGGVTVDESSGNELEFGVYGALPLGSGRVALTTALDGRWHTGIGADATISTPAVLGFGGTVGLAMNMGRLSLRPFVRGQFARLDVSGSDVNGSGFAGGLTIGAPLP